MVGLKGVTSRKRADPNCRSSNNCPLRLGLADCHAVRNGGRPPQPALVRKCLFVPQGKFVLELPSFSHLITERQSIEEMRSSKGERKIGVGTVYSRDRMHESRGWYC